MSSETLPLFPFCEVSFELKNLGWEKAFHALFWRDTREAVRGLEMR